MIKEDSEEKLKDIKIKRGYVATNFAYIESVIARVITIHYFKANDEEFLSEVLEDEYFNFGLLLNILEKIIKKESIKDFPIGKLRRLQKLRNIIIHSQIIAKAMTFKDQPKIIDIDVIKFKHGGKELDVDLIFNEYDDIEKVIKLALEALPGGKNIQLSFTDQVS